jgi:hypothetical protein
VAYESASKESTASKRPLHLKKPALKTPAQAMIDRYQKIQVVEPVHLGTIDNPFNPHAHPLHKKNAHSKTAFLLNNISLMAGHAPTTPNREAAG